MPGRKPHSRKKAKKRKKKKKKKKKREKKAKKSEKKAVASKAVRGSNKKTWLVARKKGEKAVDSTTGCELSV